MTAEQVESATSPSSAQGDALVEAHASGSTALAARVAITVEDNRKPRFAPLSSLPAAASAGPRGPVMLIVLVIVLLFRGAAGVVRVCLTRLLGLENQVDRLEEENNRLQASHAEYETQPLHADAGRAKGAPVSGPRSRCLEWQLLKCAHGVNTEDAEQTFSDIRRCSATLRQDGDCSLTSIPGASRALAQRSKAASTLSPRPHTNRPGHHI